MWLVTVLITYTDRLSLLLEWVAKLRLKLKDGWLREVN
jgi:hypothetical protein